MGFKKRGGLALAILLILLFSGIAYAQTLEDIFNMLRLMMPIATDVSLAKLAPIKVAPGFISTRGRLFPGTKSLGVANEQIFPNPVGPGEDLMVKVTLYNTGAVAAENVSLILEAPAMFQLKSISKDITNIPQLCAGCAIDVTYFFVVDSRAPPGVYPLRFKLIEPTDIVLDLYETLIQVIARPKIVMLESAISPDIVRPNDIANLSVKIKNVGTGTARAIEISLQLVGRPIIPIGDNSKYIEKLSADEEREIDFPLRISKDARIMSYQIPMQIVASDDSRTSPTATLEMVGLTVLGEALISPASISTIPPTVRAGEEFTLLFKIENAGTGDARAISATVDLPFVGNKKAFLSRIGPHEDAPAVFLLRASFAGTYDYTLNIEFTDDLGTKIVSYDLQLIVYPGKTAGIMALLFVVVVLAAGLAFYLHKRRPRWLFKSS